MMKDRQGGVQSWKLALGQMRVVGGEPDLNVERAVDRVGLAASRGARLVLLPEALDLGWTHPSAREGASGLDRSRLPVCRIRGC
jgi:predicted amidohydrolase